MAAQFQFVMHSGPTPGKTFPIEGDVLTLGREAGNQIVINDAEISRKHIQLVFQGGKYILTDLGSTNGTFVNGQRLTGQHILQPGEVVSLGEQINLLFEAVTVSDPNATMLSSSKPARSTKAAQAAPPPPAPAPMPPAQSSAYAGQVPAGPAAPAASGPAGQAKSRTPMIIAGVVVLCLICACAGGLYYIDSANLWCTFFPFLFGAACG